jgi:cytochrome c-type biogenesis protein CcmH
MRAWLFAALVAGLPVLGGAAWAIGDPNEALPDKAQEARAVAIGEQLRCLVCQNESIEDSGADLAHDLRRLVRQQVAAGQSDAQVVQWLVARYGNFVRLSPPFEWSTVLLWGSPVLAVLVGGGIALFARQRRPAMPAPLDAAEQARLRSLLDT